MSSEIDAVIAGRRSIRRYRAEPVAVDVLEDLIEAACWAPSAHNRQPWRFRPGRADEAARAEDVWSGG